MVALMLGLFPFGTANADWQYTKWGMTPEQVKAASSVATQTNQDRKLDSSTDKTKLIAPYKSGRFNFRADFMFNGADRLSVVKLQLADAKLCPELVAELSGAYGPPADKAVSAISRLYKWWDEKNKNVVVFFQIGSESCSIQYTPKPAAGAAGGL